MANLFIIVMSDEDNKVTMRKAETEENVLNMVSNIKGTSKMDRVFRVDELGHVTHLNIVFDGRLKLQEVLF